MKNINIEKNSDDSIGSTWRQVSWSPWRRQKMRAAVQPGEQPRMFRLNINACPPINNWKGNVNRHWTGMPRECAAAARLATLTHFRRGPKQTSLFDFGGIVAVRSGRWRLLICAVYVNLAKIRSRYFGGKLLWDRQFELEMKIIFLFYSTQMVKIVIKM